jgi:REP element-mobilizing transposase RayT
MAAMSRPLRIERAGGWYHLTARGNERRPIYRDDKDRWHFCELLAELVARFRVRLHAYELMDNHYHLLVELNEPNLSRMGQWLNLSYAAWFNRRHGRSGHLFQGRFGSVIVDPASWGLELSRYVHLNPVRVGKLGLGKKDRQRMHAGASAKPEGRLMKQRIGLLRRYRWSSYRAYIGLAKRPEWLECERILNLGGGRKEGRQRIYQEYVESALGEGLLRSPWAELREQVVLGGEQFLNRLREHVRGNAREQGAVRRLSRERPKLSTIRATVEKVKGQGWEQIRERHGDSGRDLVMYLGQRVCGMKLHELAAVAGLRDYSAVSIAIRRFERRLTRSRQDQDLLKQVCQMSNVEM